MLLRKLRRHLTLIVLLALTKLQLVSCAPKSWPYMKNHDIWGGNNTINSVNNKPHNLIYSHKNNLESTAIGHLKNDRRKAKVINFFSSFSVDDECLSDDGRRIGMCLNVYECRLQGGTSRGDCALGFGACCIFETSCDGEIFNNITYFMSPKFPALMPYDKDHCALKIKLVSDDISQIRLDFLHFSLGQPNRSTGICENDIFSLEGGSSPFVLCGQNSGQHVFYDVVSSKARQIQELKININLNKRSISSRLWEIRITQIPFSARSPTGCLQYFTGAEGIIQTFNFADNGRHLANQNYRSCIRQEVGKCSIQYEPCDDNSFRIGPSRPLNNNLPGSGGSNIGSSGTMGSGTLSDPASGTLGDEFEPVNNDDLVGEESMLDENGDPVNDEDNQIGDDNNNDGMPPNGDDGNGDGDNPSNPADENGTNEGDQQADETQQDENTQNDEEGSGGGDGSFFPTFSFPNFFRSFSGRQSRQLYSPCSDRITLPCIVEDFIGAGMGTIQSCTPVICGNSFCRSRGDGCRVETSVTPFHIGVHFGDGKKNKGSPEDNIGACLRYKQLPCV